MRLYLTKKQALEKYPITEAELYNLITAAASDDIIQGNGEEMIYDDAIAAYVAERDITPEKFKDLKGNLLGLNEAGLKYGISMSVISRWAKRGLLEIKREEGLKKLVDEADVAYLAKIGRAKKMRPGKKPFYKARAES